MKDALEKGYCTRPKCRTHVDPGHGIQWVDEKGDLQRFCTPCYEGMFKEREEKSNGKPSTRRGV